MNCLCRHSELPYYHSRPESLVANFKNFARRVKPHRGVLTSYNPRFYACRELVYQLHLRTVFRCLLALLVLSVHLYVLYALINFGRNF